MGWGQASHRMPRCHADRRSAPSTRWLTALGAALWHTPAHCAAWGSHPLFAPGSPPRRAHLVLVHALAALVAAAALAARGLVIGQVLQVCKEALCQRRHGAGRGRALRPSWRASSAALPLPRRRCRRVRLSDDVTYRL